MDESNLGPAEKAGDTVASPEGSAAAQISASESSPSATAASSPPLPGSAKRSALPIASQDGSSRRASADDADYDNAAVVAGPEYGSLKHDRIQRLFALFRTGAAFGRDALRIRLGLRPKNPFVAGVTINTVCNLRCSYCFIGRESEHFPEGFAKQGLPADEIKAILRNIRVDTGMLIITGGEPFLHRELEEILRYAKRELHFVNISVATNGLFLPKRSSCLRYIDRLGISYDFTRAREYPKEMERMLGYLVDLKAKKVLPPVHFTMTLLRNEDLAPLEKFAAFCKENGFKIWMQPERDHGDFRDWSWFISTIRGLQSRFGRNLILNDLQIVESFAQATSSSSSQPAAQAAPQSAPGSPASGPLASGAQSAEVAAPPTTAADSAPRCYPELRLHINEDGNLCFPCNRLEHLYPAGSVLDKSVMTRWNEATEAHGQFPRAECNGCGFTCYFETAGLYQRPHSFLLKAFKHISPDRGRERGLSA